ncbi:MULTISPECIES: hypothetical protein [unclassified Corallococcus]|uniref:hypothetical protein n=1 Tax=unclassified Corallococcus TaxID=2685029 RepID=UPI001F5D26DE|nr:MULTISPECIES: hypothetical protein [unclassified Corallococcus]WAS87850.1 hypothetical protein O0N60_12920 [Corallococcus sp. NCRR]
MATITVDLSTDPISYSPGPEVKHGDTVVFSLGSYPASYTATITFPDGNCLTVSASNPYPYELGGTHALATSPLTVSMTAPKRLYEFNAVIDDGTRARSTEPLHPTERDRKNGGIDVSSDPPEDPI